MSNPQFQIVLNGVLAGFDPQQVQTDFANLFSIDVEKATRMFAAAKAIIKSGVDENTANKYLTRLASIGVDASAEAIVVQQEPVVTSSTEETGTNDVFTENVPDEPGIVEQERSLASDENIVISAAQSSSQKKRYSFSFTGSGFEYFKIWIVNLMLSIITLGIYSAWAKVRNKQYFYGNTHIADATFEYTAEPLKILKGRIIAFLLYAGLIYANHASVVVSVVVAIIFMAFLPWIIVASLRFNARHTSYRNIPFRFTGTVMGALKTFLGWPLLGLLSLGILFPFVWKKQAQYITNNHSYGTEPFHFDVSVKEYYKMLLILIGATIVFFFVLGSLIGGSIFTSIASGGGFDPSAIMSSLVPAMIVYLLFYFALGAYVVVTMANIHFNNTRLQHHQFQSDWAVSSYLGLLVTNTLGILFTLGLFIPFAKVRTAQYRAAHTDLIVAGDLDNFVARELEQSNSLGEGVHDMFDIDISI